MAQISCKKTSVSFLKSYVELCIVWKGAGKESIWETIGANQLKIRCTTTYSIRSHVKQRAVKWDQSTQQSESHEIRPEW
jgi:hypothetical protein